MPYQTRKGTKVLQQKASSLAIIAEIYRDADEYVVYDRFSVGDRYEPRFAAEPPDHLLVWNVDAGKHPALEGMAHALNLVTGQQALIPWNAMAHSVKPYEGSI